VADRNAALMTSVARMYYLDGLGQSEIANVFGVSRSTVSRLLTTARDHGIVRISVDDGDPFDRELERALIDRFGLDQAVVVQRMDVQSENLRRAVAYFAAPVVADWVRMSRLIGLSGGRTIAQLTSFIASQAHTRHLDVVPLMGMVGSAPSGTDASELTRTLSSRFRGAFHTINAPLFMEAPESRDLLTSHQHVRSVLDVFPTLDLALVGIGTLRDSVLAERQSIQPSDIEELTAQGAVGEICGRFFDAEGRECDSAIRDRVISIDFATLRRVARVAAITTGATRPDAIRAAMRGRLINTIVTDEKTARAVLGPDECTNGGGRAGAART
jgi:DNA-binding transcriptional regulator LsrR (DeoR family)